MSEEGTGKIVNCAFLFKIGAKMFYNCTHDFDPDGRLWCSTKNGRPCYLDLAGGVVGWLGVGMCGGGGATVGGAIAMSE